MAGVGEQAGSCGARKRRSDQSRKPRSGSAGPQGSSQGGMVDSEAGHSLNVMEGEQEDRRKRHERHIKRPGDQDPHVQPHRRTGVDLPKGGMPPPPQLKLKLKVGGTTRTVQVASPQDKSSPGQDGLEGRPVLEFPVPGPANDAKKGVVKLKLKSTGSSGAPKRAYIPPPSDDESGSDDSLPPRRSQKVMQLRNKRVKSEDPDFEDLPTSSSPEQSLGKPAQDCTPLGSRKRAVPMKYRDGIDIESGDEAKAALGRQKGAKRKRIQQGVDDEDEPPKYRRGASAGGESEEPESSSPTEGAEQRGSEKPLTARQRAMQGRSDSPVVDFAEVLKKPKRKPKKEDSEAERLLKKEEAARKRRLQSEKAARESQEAAMQKILGQDGSRKKKEAKLQQKREEMKEERAAASLEVAIACTRLTMGPQGTSLAFSQDLGLPALLQPGAPRLPSSRPLCAGPSCNKEFRYSCSTSRLPLCSLRCYKAIRGLSVYKEAVAKVAACRSSPLVDLKKDARTPLLEVS